MGASQCGALTFALASQNVRLTISEDVIQGMSNFPKAVMESAPTLRGIVRTFVKLPYETINYRDYSFPVASFFVRMGAGD